MSHKKQLVITKGPPSANGKTYSHIYGLHGYVPLKKESFASLSLEQSIQITLYLWKRGTFN